MIREDIKVGSHGEDYRSWMSSPVFLMAGGLLLVSILLAVLSFSVFHLPLLGSAAVMISVMMIVTLCWISWIRWEYSFTGGGMMGHVHQIVLSHLDFDGKGKLLDVGCGSGALSVRAALAWPDASIVGIDYWSAVYSYSQRLCEENAVSEGVSSRCLFLHGDANSLDFPDESFDAVVSNYVYHNITGADKCSLLLETLRVLKKGGTFALNDDMKPGLYGDIGAFAEKLRNMGYEDVRIIDTAQEAFGSHRRAALMMLGHSRMLVGRK